MYESTQNKKITINYPKLIENFKKVKQTFNCYRSLKALNKESGCSHHILTIIKNLLIFETFC